MEQEHSVHQRIVIISTAIEQLICEIPVKALVVVDRSTAEIVKPHSESN